MAVAPPLQRGPKQGQSTTQTPVAETSQTGPVSGTRWQGLQAPHTDAASRLEFHPQHPTVTSLSASAKAQLSRLVQILIDAIHAMRADFGAIPPRAWQGMIDELFPSEGVALRATLANIGQTLNAYTEAIQAKGVTPNVSSTLAPLGLTSASRLPPAHASVSRLPAPASQYSNVPFPTPMRPIDVQSHAGLNRNERRPSDWESAVAWIHLQANSVMSRGHRRVYVHLERQSCTLTMADRTFPDQQRAAAQEQERRVPQPTVQIRSNTEPWPILPGGLQLEARDEPIGLCHGLPIPALFDESVQGDSVGLCHGLSAPALFGSVQRLEHAAIRASRPAQRPRGQTLNRRLAITIKELLNPAPVEQSMGLASLVQPHVSIMLATTQAGQVGALVEHGGTPAQNVAAVPSMPSQVRIIDSTDDQTGDDEEPLRLSSANKRQLEELDGAEVTGSRSKRSRMD